MEVDRVEGVALSRVMGVKGKYREGFARKKWREEEMGMGKGSLDVKGIVKIRERGVVR